MVNGIQKCTVSNGCFHQNWSGKRQPEGWTDVPTLGEMDLKPNGRACETAPRGSACRQALTPIPLTRVLTDCDTWLETSVNGHEPSTTKMGHLFKTDERFHGLNPKTRTGFSKAGLGLTFQTTSVQPHGTETNPQTDIAPSDSD